MCFFFFFFKSKIQPIYSRDEYLLTVAAILMLRTAKPLENEASSCMCVQTWLQIWLGFSLPAQQVTDMFASAQLPPETTRGLCQSAVKRLLRARSHTSGRFCSTLEMRVR